MNTSTQVYANQFKLSIVGDVDLNVREAFELQAEAVDVSFSKKQACCSVVFRTDSAGRLLSFLSESIGKHSMDLVVFSYAPYDKKNNSDKRNPKVVNCIALKRAQLNEMATSYDYQDGSAARIYATFYTKRSNVKTV